LVQALQVVVAWWRFQPGGSVYKQPTATPTFGGMMQRQAASAPGFMDKLRQGLGAVGRFATRSWQLNGTVTYVGYS
jgi:hypothetical protein